MPKKHRTAPLSMSQPSSFMACRRQSLMRSMALTALLCVGCATELAAQLTDHAMTGAARPSCLDSIPANEMTRVPVYAYVHATDSASSGLRANVENLLQLIATHVDSLLGGRSDVLPKGEPLVTWRGIGSDLIVVLHRDGHVTHRVQSDHADTAAAALFGRAIDEVGGASSLVGVSLDPRTDSASFAIVIASAIVDENRRVLKPSPDAVAIPILSVASPWQRGAIPKAGNKGPTYPPSARSAGMGATIIMQFLVDSVGSVVDSSIRDIWPKDKPRPTGEMGKHYESFVDAVRKVLPRFKFEPAVIGGCKTTQLVQMPFKFSLGWE